MRKFEKVSIDTWIDAAGVENDYLYKDIKLPQRATSKSAGYDIYLPDTITINPNTQVVIPTGIKADMEDDDVLLIIIRSSLGIKKGLSISNQTGVIDADYYNNKDNEGHIFMCLKNNTSETVTLEKGDRVAQGLFIKYNTVENDEPIKNERSGGIGSTSN